MTASHGMFSFPFFSGNRNEKGLPAKGNFTPTKPTVTPIPLFNNFNRMKRKRSDSSPVSPRLQSPIPKKRLDTSSHVHIPVLESQRMVLPSHGTQMIEINAPGHFGATVFQTSREEGNETSQTVQEQTRSIHDRPTDSGSQELPPNVTNAAAGISNTGELHQAIEAQFGLEILLKHKELRLIDQEFAKCQVALEQLRRCQLVPFPAMSSEYEAMQAASTGSGPVFNDRAAHAAPWGVANGPYSRHYGRWLIPDSAFDESVPEDVQVPYHGGNYIPDRATRGSKSDAGTFGSKSRSQRGSNSAKLQALPDGYAEPKDLKAPVIVKRGSDGKMVKLVCLDCRRSNFKGAQGFINHCRISHSRQFLSHDAAIEASGEEIDADAEGIVGEVNHLHGSQATASSALVHPLIRSSAQLARTSTEQSMSSTSKRKQSQVNSANTDKQQMGLKISPDTSTPPHSSIAPQTTQPHLIPFNPSPQTPHLSALFAKMGRGGDLREMVSQAKARPSDDLSQSSDEEEDGDEAMEAAAESSSAPQSRSTRGVIRGGNLFARRSKSPKPFEETPVHHAYPKGLQKPSYLSNINIHRTYPPQYHSGGIHEDHDIPMQDSGAPFDLSPNTTEAHTAPSLVSDDGDYENTHSESESPSYVEADEDDIRAEVVDHDDMDLREGSSADHHLGLGGKPHGPTAEERTPAMRPPISVYSRESGQRHVSFENAVRREDCGVRSKDRE